MLLDSSLNPLLPGEYEQITFEDVCIVAQPEGAPCRAYDYSGNLISDFVVYTTDRLTYTEGEQTICSADGGNETVDVYKNAKAMSYTVRFGEYDYRYGLMDNSGKFITRPIYESISAIGPDLYFCDPQGVIINGEGKPVN